MPFQTYWANVVFGSNVTTSFAVQANTVTEAARIAAHFYDANTTVTFLSGNVRGAAFVASGAVLSAANLASNPGGSANITVFVKDPSAPDFLTMAWRVPVTVFPLPITTPRVDYLASANGFGGTVYTTQLGF